MKATKERLRVLYYFLLRPTTPSSWIKIIILTNGRALDYFLFRYNQKPCHDYTDKILMENKSMILPATGDKKVILFLPRLFYIFLFNDFLRSAPWGGLSYLHGLPGQGFPQAVKARSCWNPIPTWPTSVPWKNLLAPQSLQHFNSATGRLRPIFSKAMSNPDKWDEYVNEIIFFPEKRENNF